MIESVVPIGATVREGDAEFGVTWLLVGADWMILDYATRGVDPPSALSITDDRGWSYAPMGGGATGDHMELLRCHRAFREGLHPDATELRLTLFEGRADGRRLVETTVPIAERVQAGELEAEVVSHSPSLSAATHACLECGRRGDQWICSECKVNGLALAARRSGQLVPQAIVSIPGALDSASGLRQAVAGILAWENTFVLRLVFEPSAPNDAHRFHDPPGPVVGRWTAEDATGRAFVGARRRWGFTQSGGRALGDAEIEFMPELEPGSRTVLVRRESPDGRVLLELELPLDPSA